MKRRALLATLAGMTTAGCAESLENAGILDTPADTPTPRVVVETVVRTPTPTRSPTPTETTPPTSTPSPTSTETPSPTPETPTATPTPPSAPAERAAWFVDRARARLGGAVAAIHTTAGSIDEIGDVYDYDAAPVTAALEGAEADLETARSTASGAQATIIGLLEEYRSAVDGLRAVAGRIPAIHERVTTGADRLENDRYADAMTAFEGAKAPYKRARSGFDPVRTTLAEAGPQLVDDEPIALETFRSHVRATRATLDAVEVLYKGGRSYSSGWADLSAGRGRYRSGAFEDAKRRFKGAIEHFAIADEWYATGETTESIAAIGRIGLRACQSKRSLDASQRFRGASQARLAGDDERATDREGKARAALDRECP